MRLQLRRLCSAPARLSVHTINQAVRTAQYAVRGELILRAAKLQEELRAGGGGGKGFDRLVECNIGNPQALRQQPLSFNRQVLAILAMPALLQNPALRTSFGADAIARAEEYLRSIPAGVGAYSESQGFRLVRQQVADFIAARDGVPAQRDDIFLTDGASKAVEFIFKILLRGASDGVLVPIPQYPLYSATLALASAQMLGYELDEANGWAMPLDELEKKHAAAVAAGVTPRALVVINPGNPTGNTLPRDNMEAVVRFCSKHHLVLMADEVYQENIYDDALPFHSFKKVLKQMTPEPPLQLVSFHSTSKGFLGECGLRGGYMELCGFDPEVQAQLLKLVSIGLCSNTMGQIGLGLMVQPPKPGDASYATYAAEKDGILQSLKRRATKLVSALNELEGVTCNQPQGAMYAFPSITLPPNAVAAAEAAGKVPDTFYALALLEATGIVVVPGSGFGQKENTWHFRTTFLPPEDEMEAVVGRMTAFHRDFMQQYS